MLKGKLTLLIALVLMFGAFTAQAAAPGAAQVTLTLEKDSFRNDEGIGVKVSISNPGKQTVRILRWLTPLDGVKEDLFLVTVDGKPVEYIGAHYKRPAPTDRDYLTLKAGESVETTIELGGYYDLSQTGLYQVSYNVEAYNLFSHKPESILATEDSLKSAAAEAWIDGRETKAPVEATPDAVSGATTFTGCSTTRQSALVTARNNASSYAANSYSYLQAGTVGPRYTTWFGVYSSTRYNTVRSHFSSIKNAMDTASVNFNCNCTDSAYAYVYPTQPYNIYLCNAFWNAPATGTDSKAGTLIHEMSHFNVVAGTDDYAYGQTAAKRLATQNPKRAINNADSHEYFAENTPFQN